MNIKTSKSILSGEIKVPGSKSHTIRALMLSSLADGTSIIHNPLPSADCLSTGNAIPLIGAEINFNQSSDGVLGDTWTVKGAGTKIHIPDDVVNVGDSGSLLYFMTPIVSTLNGWSVFTGDESIRHRPVAHMIDALKQLGAEAYITRPGSECCPFIVKGPLVTTNKVVTDGRLSQYVSGMMMASVRMNGKLCIELTDPMETPYITMTQKWLEYVGAKVFVSNDYKHIEVEGPVNIKAFEKTIPSDWEAVAFPLIAALVTDSDIVIKDVDGSGTQGDDAIVEILQSLGADIEWNKSNSTLRVRGMKKSRNGIGYLSTEKNPSGVLRVRMSGFPDAVCALAVISCFVEGTVILEDASVCRKKETDRLKVLTEQLTILGADIEEQENGLLIKGHSPINKDGSVNNKFSLHGGKVNAYNDHRIAMSLACLGLGLKDNEQIEIPGAECCSVSFPKFFERMKEIGAQFE